MNQLRILLLPFSWIYGFIMLLRNGLYSLNLLSSYKIPGKSIVIGNLSVGGTGKTPHVDYLINLIKSDGGKAATLSRGYGRSTTGRIEVSMDSTSETVGDEPLFYKLKHGKSLPVVVAENRKEGVEFLRDKFPLETVILLDDAFQHRKVTAGLNIIITDYNQLFTKDYVIPAGNLREPKSGKNRADLIVVSKCPELSEIEQNKIRKELNFKNDNIFFSSIRYEELKGFTSEPAPSFEKALVVTGIGNAKPLISHLEKHCEVEHIEYRDHHQFTANDLKEIHEKFDSFASRNKIIITTEKDAMRLRDLGGIRNKLNHWFYIPISVEFSNQNIFNHIIKDYVREN